MRGFKIRLVMLLFLWGMLIAAGYVLTVADNRLYQIGTFLVSSVVVFYGDTFWRRRKEKKLKRLGA